MIPGSYAPPNSSEIWNFKHLQTIKSSEWSTSYDQLLREFHVVAIPAARGMMAGRHWAVLMHCACQGVVAVHVLPRSPYRCKPFKHPAGFDHGTHDFPTWLEDDLDANDLPFFTVLEHGHVMPRSIARFRPQLRLCCKSVLTCIDLFPIYSS